jgi:hypothetical protein
MNLRLVFSNLGLKASEKKNDVKNHHKKNLKVHMPEMKYDNGEIRVCVLGCKMLE